MQAAPVLQEYTAEIRSTESFVPTSIQEIELSQALPTFVAYDERRACTYGRVSCLVRLHTRPLGKVTLTFEHETLTPAVYIPQIWRALSAEINAHLRADGLADVLTLSPAGLPTADLPVCQQERARFLLAAPFASVVLCTRDRPDRLARCLPALLAQQYPDYEVVLVDNAPSSEATAAFIERHYGRERRLRYVREQRAGLSAARNRGVREARGEIVAFTDDNVIADAHWLSGLAHGFTVTDHVACVTGLILPLELDTPAQFWFEACSSFARGFTRRIFDLREYVWPKPAYPYIVGACGAGASMAFTASFLHDIGGFNPALGAGTPAHGGEDLATFFQVIIRGYRLVYEPESLLYHQHRQSYAELQTQLYRYGVGFTAYLTMIVLEHPWRLFDCCCKLVRSLIALARTHRTTSEEASQDLPVPKELQRLERQGRLRGPLAYMRARRAAGWRKSGLDLAQISGFESTGSA